MSTPAKVPVTAAAEWSVWSTTARVVVTDPGTLAEARALVEAELAAVGRAASRFRPDSEISRLHLAHGRPQQVSPLLAALVGAALEAARRTDGRVDPTVGAALRAIGYDRDFEDLPGREIGRLPTPTGAGVPVLVRPVPGWRQVRLDGTTLTLPAGVVLDLGATAKAVTADRCAALVRDRLGTGVLVSLGGDIATAGPAPEGGWQVLVHDHDDDPSSLVSLPGGAAIATSSTARRVWTHDGRVVHHVLDPRTGQPAVPVWRTVTVAAPTCAEANTLTTASVVRGHSAVGWLRALGVPARLVDANGAVFTTPAWPEQADGTARLEAADRPRAATA